MTISEWEAAHPAPVVPEPPKDFYDEPRLTLWEASELQDSIEVRDEHGGMMVVKCEADGMFYVVQRP